MSWVDDPPDLKSVFLKTAIHETELVALVKNDDGETSYLTRDFLEAVHRTNPIYKKAAVELAAFTVETLITELVNTAQEERLRYRRIDNLFALSLHQNLKNPDKNAVEYLVTRPEADYLVELMENKLGGLIDHCEMGSGRAATAASHNINQLLKISSFDLT